MVQVSYPGVYIQEVPSGVRTIAAVSTSMTLFVGRTYTGPFGPGPVPQLITSFSDFERTFGTLEQNAGFSEMAQQVRQFYLNGGQTAWVVRILGLGADTAAMTVQNTAVGGAPSDDTAIFTAPSAGTFANGTRVSVNYAGSNADDRFALSLDRDGTTEFYTNLSMDPDSTR